MNTHTTFSKEDFIRLIMSNAEYNSSSEAVAREYLSSRGLDVDSIVADGVSRIKALQQRIQATKSAENTKEVEKDDHGAKPLYGFQWNHESVKLLINESGNVDPVEAIKNRARNLVLNAYELGWDGPPYDPIKLAEYFNIDVIPNDSVIDARTVPIAGNRFQIQYNPYQKLTRRNFSISHEIAHTLFSDCANSIRNREAEPQENRELEQLCNAAAAEIQLPYAIFSNDANSSAPSVEGLISLATKYKSSLESVLIRYTEVIDKPCAVLIGIFQTDTKIKIDYHKSSRLFPVKLPKSLEIPLDSKAYECVSPGWTARETRSWPILGGKSYNIFSIGISPYRRDNKPRVGIVVLPVDDSPVSPETGKVVLEFGDATKPRGKGKRIIAQVVNSSAALGRGFGLSLAKNYPIVSSKLKEWHADRNRFQMGNTNTVEIDKNLFVFQMLAQKGLYTKNNEIPLKYEDLRKCLIQLREFAIESNGSIHMPAIGAGQAQGNWDIIIGMIHDELVNYGLKVNIYFLPGSTINIKHNSNLTTFNESSTWGTGKLF